MKRREFLKDLSITAAALVLGGGYGSSACRMFQQNMQSGGYAAAQLPLRPPGAVPEREFLSRCIRCQRCASVCPNNAILPLDTSYGPERRKTPYIKPRRQACMLCNRQEGRYLKCTQACPTGALQRIGKEVDDITRNVRMGTARIDKTLCYSYNNWSCGACYRACPLPSRAMKLGMWEKPEVVPEECIGCGACERACIRYPQAIRVEPRSII